MEWRKCFMSDTGAEYALGPLTSSSFRCIADFVLLCCRARPSFTQCALRWSLYQSITRHAC